MIKAILWDLDGVLIDSEPIVYKRWATTYKEFGFSLPSNVFFKYIGRRPEEIFYAVNKELGIDVKLTYEEAYAIHRKRRGRNPRIPFVLHAKEVLESLYIDYRMAIVTSSNMEWLQAMLKPIPYQKYISFFVTGEKINNPKPHPESYLKAIDGLQVKAYEAVVVEDTSHGITSGKKAGATVIARRAKHNKDHDLSQADFIIDDMKEIPKLIKTIS